MYAGFAILIFYFYNSLLEESVADARGGGGGDCSSSVTDYYNYERSNSKRDQGVGYIGGDRFDVVGRRSYGKTVNTHHHEVF